MMKLSNAELIRMLGSNDRVEADKTFTSFRAYFLPQLKQVVGKMVSDRDAVDDIVQEVFIRIWDLRAVLKALGNVEAYFTTAAKNKALDENERRKQDQSFRTEYWRIENHEEEMPNFDAEEPDERISIVRKLVEELSPRRSQVIKDLVFNGKNGKQIQEEMNISPNSYRNYRRDGYLEMRRRIAEMNKTTNDLIKGINP